MLLLSRICFILMLAFASNFALPQLKSNTTSVETADSNFQFTIEKLDKSISGDKLIYGTVTQIKKAVGPDNIKVITRKSAYNCTRKEFVVKEASIQDKSGLPLAPTGVQTDAIIVPELEINKKEVAFMCGDVETKPPEVQPVVPMLTERLKK